MQCIINNQGLGALCFRWQTTKSTAPVWQNWACGITEALEESYVLTLNFAFCFSRSFKSLSSTEGTSSEKGNGSILQGNRTQQVLHSALAYQETPCQWQPVAHITNWQNDRHSDVAAIFLNAHHEWAQKFRKMTKPMRFVSMPHQHNILSFRLLFFGSQQSQQRL